MSISRPVIVHPQDDEPFDVAIARALQQSAHNQHQITLLNELLSRDAYLAEQLGILQATWALTPPPATSLLARLRRWLAWRLCGPEFTHINATHATLTCIIESLIAHLDAERDARQKLAERLAALERL